MRGRKPIPNKLKVLTGNPGKRPINDKEPKPEQIKPNCPQWLRGEARKEWRRISRELESLGLLTRIDRAALTAYCQSWGRWIEAEKEIKDKGVVLRATNGILYQNPWLSIANKERKFLQSFLTEFGMTPSSRSRIKVEKPKKKNPLEEFLHGKKKGKA